MCLEIKKSVASKPTAVAIPTNSDLSQPLAFAKKVAVQFGKTQKFVHAGLVQAALRASGIDLGNTASNIFTPKTLWKRYGQIKNTQPSARGRKVTLWEYIGEGTPSTAAIPVGTIPGNTVSQVVPGTNAGPADVTSVAVHAPATPAFVPATPANVTSGTKVSILPALREKLTGHGQRPFVGTVVEIITENNPRWPLRVEFTDGKRGLLTYNEVEVFA